MIHSLVRSAFDTGYVSVASEGLLLQLLERQPLPPNQRQELQRLNDAIELGQLQREGVGNWSIQSYLAA